MRKKDQENVIKTYFYFCKENFVYTWAMKSENPHTALVQQIIEYFEDSPNVWVWKNNTGVAVYGNRRVKYGKPGSPDVIGMLRDGRFFGIECKTGNARLNPDQRDFQARTAGFNGVYLVARSLDYVAVFVDQLGLK